jgi:hypothetical protein
MDSDKPVVEQVTDAIGNAAAVTTEAAKTVVRRVRKAAARVGRKATPKKAVKAPKARKTAMKSTARKSAGKPAVKKAAGKKKKARKARR